MDNPFLVLKVCPQLVLGTLVAQQCFEQDNCNYDIEVLGKKLFPLILGIMPIDDAMGGYDIELHQHHVNIKRHESFVKVCG